MFSTAGVQRTKRCGIDFRKEWSLLHESAECGRSVRVRSTERSGIEKSTPGQIIF